MNASKRFVLALLGAIPALSCRQLAGIQDLPQPCADPDMLDDMEDGIADICKTSGRNGWWYKASDGTSTTDVAFGLEPIPGGRGASRSAAHLKGAGFESWGALMAFDLKVDGPAHVPYNASGTAGIKFWLKSDVPLVFELPIAATMPPLYGGSCVDTARKTNCNNHYRYSIANPGNDWIEVQVPYEALAQWDGTPAVTPQPGAPAFSPHDLISVQFVAPTFASFDIWVDDVRFFYGCPATGCLPTCTDPARPVACPAKSEIPAACWPAETICDGLTNLPGIWGTGPDDVWAVGYNGAILHWDGIAWSFFESGSTGFLSVPWGSADDDVWVVGWGPTILHWNGTAWSKVPSGATEDLYAVWGSGPDDVWAAGRAGTFLHWDGSIWSPVPGGTTDTLIRIWGSGPNDVWAAGGGETSDQAAIVHWDGSAWSAVSVTAPPLVGIWGSGPNDVWATGAQGTILHWDGAAWLAMKSNTSADLATVWGSGPNDVWSVAADGSIIHWNGSKWSGVPSGVDVGLVGVWASAPDDAWATGLDGTVLHWNGVAWSRLVVTGWGVR